MEPNNTCEKCRCVDGQCFNEISLDLDPLPINALDLLTMDLLNIKYIDVDIPIFDPTINVNMEQDPLKEEPIVDLDLDLEKVMTDIERSANFNSVEEGVDALNNPDTIFTRLQNAFNTFKEAVGRQMTYSEMRNMMG
jgi:hypothetical protein